MIVTPHITPLKPRKLLIPFAQMNWRIGASGRANWRKSILGVYALFLFILIAGVPRGNAAAALFLEEPYGKLGAFMAQGHAAVYLSRVCAETPLVLRRCGPGES